MSTRVGCAQAHVWGTHARQCAPQEKGLEGEPAHRLPHEKANHFHFQEEALRMLSLVTHWARVDDAELGRPKLSGQEEANPLAVPMMLLYVIDEVCRDDEELRQSYCEDEEWAVQQILKHLQVNSNTFF